MTVDTETDHQGRPYVGSGPPVTFLPEATAENTASARESDIPFVNAVLVDDVPSSPPAYNPGYQGLTPTTEPSSGAILTMASAGNTPAGVPTGYTSTGIPQASAATTSPTTFIASPASVTPIIATQQPQVQGTTTRPPPPGVPPGGRWVKLRGVGGNSEFSLCSKTVGFVSCPQFFSWNVMCSSQCQAWLSCGIISAVFCIFMCFPCGVWAFCCPCDEESAYLVNGKLFDEGGGMIGSSRNRVYR